MKIPKGKSESVNLRTDNTTAKRKRTNNDIQNTTHKIKDRATGTSLKTRSELGCSRKVSSSCSTSRNRHATLVNVVHSI